MNVSSSVEEGFPASTGIFTEDYRALSAQAGTFEVEVRCGRRKEGEMAAADSVAVMKRPGIDLSTSGEEDAPKALRVAAWSVDAPSMSVLLQTVTASTSITAMTLWNIGVTNESLDVLITLLPTTHIKDLRIENNIPMDGVAVDECKWARLLRSRSDCNHQEADEESAEHEGDQTMLTSLSLRRNGISDSGAAFIGKTLQNNYSLVSLDLYGNTLTCSGASTIVDGLRINRTLRSLDLGGNMLGDKFAKDLSILLMGYELTHQEVVWRRQLLSNAEHEDHQRSGGSNLGAKKAVGKPSAGKPRVPSAKGKTSAKARSKDSKGGKGGKSGKNDAEAEFEEPEKVKNPLLDSVSKNADGDLVCAGNYAIVHLSLSRNGIGTTGVAALYRAVVFQQGDSNREGGGLVRLSLEGNEVDNADENLLGIRSTLAKMDPYYKDEVAQV